MLWLAAARPRWPLAVRVSGRLSSRSLRRRSLASSASSRKASASSSHLIRSALDEYDERQKLLLARLLKDLHSLALEGRDGAEASPASIDTAPSNGLRLPDDLAELTPGLAADALDSLLRGETLEQASLLRLLRASAEAMRNEPGVADLRDARVVTVVGDLHGCMPSLRAALRVCADLSGGARTSAIFAGEGTATMVFNGDFVDRGANSLEVLCSLLLLRFAQPDGSVVLLRGNHEDALLSAAYGFADEVQAKHAAAHEEVWEAVSDLFAALPLCALTSHAAIVHGGLPGPELDLGAVSSIARGRDDLRSVLQPEGQPDAALIQGLVWSDPSYDDGLHTNESRGGAGFIFGPDVARAWLERQGLRYLVRSHQVKPDGWEAIDCGGGTAVYTVFSAADYPRGEGFNSGAVLRLAGEECEASEFSIDDGGATGERGDADGGEAELAVLISTHKHRLAEAFVAADPDGRLEPDAWARILDAELEVGLDWVALREHLAVPTIQRASRGPDGSMELTDTGLVDTRRWLNSFDGVALRQRQTGKLAPPSDGSESATVAAVFAQHAVLLTVFQHLDTDHSGTVSREEFLTGVEMLNARLPPKRQLRDGENVFSLLDLDGNGELELEEFRLAFTGLATP